MSMFVECLLGRACLHSCFTTAALVYNCLFLSLSCSNSAPSFCPYYCLTKCPQTGTSTAKGRNGIAN
jgi:hypothetical protein